jgi:hypothetical protein
MGFRDRIRGLLGTGGDPVLHVADPRFDQWEVVREFGELETARAFAQQLREAGFEVVLTSDWELDEFGRGDIHLQVSPDDWSDAEAFLSNYD